MVYRCVNFGTLAAFCKRFFHISKTILPSIIAQRYTPKFNRHMWIVDLKITEIDKVMYDNWQKIFSKSMEDYVNE